MTIIHYNWKSEGPGGCDSHNIEHPCGRCALASGRISQTDALIQQGKAPKPATIRPEPDPELAGCTPHPSPEGETGICRECRDHAFFEYDENGRMYSDCCSAGPLDLDC